jgi:membrane protease subunit (stomatin/prohibitin family)
VFHSEVYFINKTVQMGVKWGTHDKVRLIDPLTGTPLSIGASGEMNISVLDSRRLLIKLVGTTLGIAWDDGSNGFTKSLQKAFRPLISNAVKTNLSTVIKNNDIDILEIDEKLDLISNDLKNKIQTRTEK